MNSKIKIHRVEQQSDEWYELRKGRLTASRAQAVGNNGTGLENYIFKLMAEYLSSGEVDHFEGEHTIRGNELEENARMIYEMENDVEVETVGFVSAGPYVGCSPDGLIDTDGLLEIKCPNDVNHYKIIDGGKKAIESKYIWQVQFQMLVTGRKWCDLAFYNPNFKENLITFRITPRETMQKKLEKGIEEGIKSIKNHLKKQNIDVEERQEDDVAKKIFS